jgi:hypothetical protein
MGHRAAVHRARGFYCTKDSDTEKMGHRAAVHRARGHSRARLSPLALWTAALYGPFFRCRCPSYNKIPLLCGQLPYGPFFRCRCPSLCERGYHIAPVLNAPKLHKSSLSGREGRSSSCTHPAEATPWAKPCSHHSLPSQSTIRARAGGRVGTTPCSLLCYTLVVPALVVLLWFWSSLRVRCVVSVRVRATSNPARYASGASCHF